MSEANRPSGGERVGPREQVVLVDERDRALGACDKIEAHRLGLRHRAFSVFVFDARRRLLLQRRAAAKYHFAGRWSNSCCGHPRPGETVLRAARRRVWEELGLRAGLRPVAVFSYSALDRASGLAECEVDHVLVGRAVPGAVRADPAEVGDWRWVDEGELAAWFASAPDAFTPWLAPALERAAAWW
ncbi:MAG: isopentenyl-diphosphate Delta-isomerase [Acidimicrobiales bacterium]